MAKILLQTTIPTTEDDWSIARFSRLSALLREAGHDVVARDRDPPGEPDSVLSTIDASDFDQMWLFAVDVGDGLTKEDCAAITRFRRGGRGLMVTRDHMDLGCSVCTLGGIGDAHYFHSQHPDPDPSHHQRDDPYTLDIDWPNFHSGANGNFQQVEIVGAPHPALASAASPTGTIRYLPAHPHEGGVGAPEGEDARVVVSGTSKATGARFNIAVAFEPGAHGGAGWAESTFHHFADYNWDPNSGCPSFVTEAPGDGLARHPEAMADTHLYALNLAAWLAGTPNEANGETFRAEKLRRPSRDEQALPRRGQRALRPVEVRFR